MDRGEWARSVSRRVEVKPLKHDIKEERPKSPKVSASVDVQILNELLQLRAEVAILRQGQAQASTSQAP